MLRAEDRCHGSDDLAAKYKLIITFRYSCPTSFSYR